MSICRNYPPMDRLFTTINLVNKPPSTTMPLHSCITPRSAFDSTIIEFLLRQDHTVERLSTSVGSGLPRKRGAARIRVKNVLCQSTHTSPECGLRIKRLPEDQTVSVMSPWSANRLGLRMSRRDRARAARGLPCQATLHATLLVDCGSAWSLE